MNAHEPTSFKASLHHAAVWNSCSSHSTTTAQYPHARYYTCAIQAHRLYDYWIYNKRSHVAKPFKATMQKHTMRRVSNCNPITSCINTSCMSARPSVWLLIDKQRHQRLGSVITSVTDSLLIRQRKKKFSFFLPHCHYRPPTCPPLVVVIVALVTNVLHVMTYTRNRGKHTAPHSLATAEYWVYGGTSIVCVQLSAHWPSGPTRRHCHLKCRNVHRSRKKANGTGACIHCAISSHFTPIHCPPIHASLTSWITAARHY